MPVPDSDPAFPYQVVKMSIKQLLDFSFGATCYLFALSMFFYFPGVEAWTSSALGHGVLPASAWIYGLLVLLVILPAVTSPLVLVSRARTYARPVLTASCLSLAALFIMAGAESPLLYGRVALVGLLTGQLLALGSMSRDSVPFNWMVYLGFILANINYPDSAILASANIGAGAYLLFAGVLLLTGHWEVSSGKKRGFSVMAG